MRLTTLNIHQFRCLDDVHLDLHPRVNIITGENGAGKTSVLEAVYFLARAKSFRNSQADKLIQRDADLLRVTGESDSGDRWGIERTQGQTRLRKNGDKGDGMEDRVRSFPVVAIDPGLHRLIEEGPTHRRAFLDWGVFHVEHAFYPCWRRYRKALDQRNKTIRTGEQGIENWESELVAMGERIDAMRRSYVKRLAEEMRQQVALHLPDFTLQVRYHPGWSGERALGETLQQSREADRKRGYTGAGPHAADIRIKLKDRSPKGVVSRGEQKMLSLLMLAAQSMLLAQSTETTPVLLIDDIAAELDDSNQARAAELLGSTQAQLLLTTLDGERTSAHYGDKVMFHVEHGGVVEG